MYGTWRLLEDEEKGYKRRLSHSLRTGLSNSIFPHALFSIAWKCDIFEIQCHPSWHPCLLYCSFLNSHKFNSNICRIGIYWLIADMLLCQNSELASVASSTFILQKISSNLVGHIFQCVFEKCLGPTVFIRLNTKPNKCSSSNHGSMTNGLKV